MRKGNHADLMDLAVLHNEVRRRASAAGLSVQFKEGLPTAGTDGKNIYIPTLRLPVTKDQITMLRKQVIHECGHVKRKRYFEIANDHGLKNGQPHNELFNLIEDEALERETAREFMGDAQSLGEGATLHYRNQMQIIGPIIEKMQKAGEKCDDKTTALGAAYTLATQTRNWDWWSRATRERFEEMQPKEIKDLVEKLRKAGFDKEIANAQTPDECWEVTKRMAKELFPDEPEPQPGQGKGNGKGDGSDKGKPQAGKDKANGDAKEQGEGKGEDDQPSPDKLHWSQLKQTDHAETHEQFQQGGGVDWSGYNARHIDPSFLPREFKPRPAPVSAPPPSSLAGRLRILIQSMGRSKMEYDRPSGKLNKRRLGILAMPVVAGSTAHKRAFKRRIPGKALNTCVHILVDVSGSMSGPKKEIAAKAADRLCVDLSRAVRVPTAVTAFGGDCNVPLWKMKDFHEPAIPGHVAALNNCHGGGNSDGDAVLYAGETLVARKEPRKILIVLSDGMPTGAAAGKSPADMLKTAIKTVKDRGVEVYGIGICDSSVKMFYGKECKVISNLEEFDSALLTTLSDKLIANG